MKKKFGIVLILMLMLTLIFSGCGNTEKANEEPATQEEAVTINISAAASLTEALTEIQAEYEKDNNATLLFNFAGSGALQKQIEEGAPCDLFISAAGSNVDMLAEKGLIDEESRKNLLGNTLTLVVSSEKAETIKSYEDLASDKVESIALGTPESVPAGKYAQQSLSNLGIWENAESKVVYAKDVKQVLEYVETGNVDCGFVYKSDALLMTSGKAVLDMPSDSHDKIVYPAALIKDAPAYEAAADFYEFLQNDFSKEVFTNYGFEVL